MTDIKRGNNALSSSEGRNPPRTRSNNFKTADVPPSQQSKRMNSRLPIPPRTSSLPSKEPEEPGKPQPSTSRPSPSNSIKSRPPIPSRTSSLSSKPKRPETSQPSTPNYEAPRDPATLPQAERQIRLLRAIAYRRHGGSSEGIQTYIEPFDAASILRLVSTHSLAARDLSSPRVTRFVEWYNEASKWDTKDMNFEVLAGELHRFMARLDELFFFNLLLMRVNGPLGPRPLVELEVIDEADPERLGRFSYSDGKLQIWLKDPSTAIGDRRDFNDLLRTLVHEMCHGYLRFADARHPEHGPLVSDHDQHGRGFWGLYRYIAQTILNFTRSTKWQRQTIKVEKQAEKALNES